MKKIFYLLPFLLCGFSGMHALSPNQMDDLRSFMNEFCRLPEKIKYEMRTRYCGQLDFPEHAGMNWMSWQIEEFASCAAGEREAKNLGGQSFFESYQKARAQFIDDLNASEAGFKILEGPELKKLIIDAMKTVAEKYNDNLDGVLMVEAVRGELHGSPAFLQIMHELENVSESFSKECKSFFKIDIKALEREFFKQLEAECAK